MTRWQMSARLLSITRRVLPPLAASIAARIVFLLLGVGLFALGGWAALSLPAGLGGWSIAWILGAAIAMSLLKGFARYLEQFAGHFVAFHSLAMLRNYFYDRLEPQAPAGTDRLDSGDIMNRVTKDIDRIEVFFAHTLGPATTALIVPIVTLAWMGSTTSWTLAGVLLPFLILVGVVVPLLGSRATREAARQLRASRGVLAAHVTDSVQGVREVLSFGATERRMEQMSAIEERVRVSSRTQNAWIARRRGLNQAFVALGVVAVAIVSASMVSAGSLTLPQMGIALGIALGSFGPVLAVEDFAADLDQAFASAERVFTITDRAPVVANPASPATLGEGDITVSGVSFSYPAEESVDATQIQEGEGAQRPQVLRDVNVTIPVGKRTAIVGASGSGKSTLASLLTRTWDPTSGAIQVGGVDLRAASLENVRSHVAYAPQRPYIFNDTVRANLLLASPDASDEDLARVLDAVDLSGWVASEKDGLDTNTGDMGERLSGGQRQRLALARALLRNAPIYVLDEATSQVDPETEQRVLSGIAQQTKGRTLVEIAHRISAVKDADQIIVMDRGSIVEVGTYEQLMAAGGALSALVAREESAAR